MRKISRGALPAVRLSHLASLVLVAVLKEGVAVVYGVAPSISPLIGKSKW